jgi:pimeloyl-ACP methyl ester carboxylesterase
VRKLVLVFITAFFSTVSSAGANLSIERDGNDPKSARIVVSGLPALIPESTVVITYCWKSPRANLFCSKNRYESANGLVDTARMAPTSGSYKGVDISGPFRSSSLVKDQAPIESAGRLGREQAVVAVEFQEVNSSVARQIEVGFEHPMHSRGVDESEIDVEGTRALLLQPAQKPPRGRVLFLSGCPPNQFAGPQVSDLADQGYVVLQPLPPANAAPEALCRVNIAMLAGIVSWMNEHIPAAESHNVVVVGGSAGGAAALWLASLYPKGIDGVAVFSAPTLDFDPLLRGSPKYFNNDTPLTHIPQVSFLQAIFMGLRTIGDHTQRNRLTKAKESLVSAEEIERNSIRLNCDVPTLAFYGGLDDLTDVTADAGYLKRHCPNMEVHVFPSGDHFIVTPTWFPAGCSYTDGDFHEEGVCEANARAFEYISARLTRFIDRPHTELCEGAGGCLSRQDEVAPQSKSASPGD